MPEPTYELVCTGRTGHAEAVRVVFDPDKVSYESLIREYLRMFRPRRNFPDEKGQYRAAIFYHDKSQKETASRVLVEVLGEDSREVETLLEPAEQFYPAEEYHQNYYDKMSFGLRGR